MLLMRVVLATLVVLLLCLLLGPILKLGQLTIATRSLNLFDPVVEFGSLDVAVGINRANV